VPHAELREPSDEVGWEFLRGHLPEVVLDRIGQFLAVDELHRPWSRGFRWHPVVNKDVVTKIPPSAFLSSIAPASHDQPLS